MSRIPQDILDDLAAFAAGLRPWSEWSSWLAGHAYRLAPVIDRPRFREIKATPPIGVAEMFRDEGIAILPSESRFPGMPREPVSSIEYEVYTAVCKQKDLFRFHLPDTTFEDQTNPDTFEHSRRRMAFDERRREYRIIEPSLIGRFEGPFRLWLMSHPEMLTEYEVRNEQRWPLEKRFDVENGYRFVSELADENREMANRAFCLSRVGFSDGSKFALVLIRYTITCAYYLIFERRSNGWQRVAICMPWVT